jgi:catechol 2,3-dioxygenase-like lactoylglutathione lyase family enzyme
MEVVARQVGTAEYLGRVTGFPGVTLKLALLRAPGDDHVLELLEYASHPGEPTPRETNRPGNGHLCLQVDDLEGAFRALVEAGVPCASGRPVLVSEGVNRGAKVAYFRDPDGFTVELYQPADGR